MNNTKKSAYSIAPRKPDSMRIVLRPRNAALPVSQDQTSPLRQPEANLRQSQNATDIKDYYDANFRLTFQSASRPELSPMREQPLLEKSKSRASLNASRVGFSSAELLPPDIKQQATNLSSLEEKIENLMDLRLKQCIEHKKERNWALEAEVEKLIDSIHSLKEECDPEKVQQDIHLLDRKIKLFEKLIAENMTESDIMKKYYLAKASFKPKHQRVYTQPQVEAPFIKKDQTTTAVPVINSSTNRQNFRKPDRTAYDIYRYKNNFFNADRHKQPLPRSSYNREYLQYGVAPEQPTLPVDNEFMKGSVPEFNSSYRANFSAKRVERIDIRELDAYKDKIKNLPVIFGRKEKKELAYGLEYYRQTGRISENRRYEQKGQPGKYMLSESRREFQGSGIAGVQSSIKHQNLQKLKYQYKGKLHV